MIQERFYQYLKNEKRFSTHTQTSYRNDVSQFYAYINKEYDLENIQDVSHQIIRSWIVSMIEAGISTNSVNRKITTLKTYYRFLLREKIVEQNPMLKVTAPKGKKRLPAFVEMENMRQLLDEIEFENDFEGIRDKLILELFYSTGMRLSELIELQENSLNQHQQTIKVIGKRNKERIIPVAKGLIELIQEYQRQKQKEGLNNASLFVTKKGKKLYPKLVYRLVNNYLSKVTTISKKSPHVLRHTFATHMLNNGADLNAIKELLGHADLSATQVYTHNTFEKLKSIYNQAHPRAEEK